jgi:hypothetical protein
MLTEQKFYVYLTEIDCVKLQEIVEEYQPVIKPKTVPFIVKPKTELSRIFRRTRKVT